jgi:hypothetical protein
MSENIEHKAVEIGEIKGGVKLKAGHRTIVIVNGAQGNARYGKFEGQFDEDADDPNADKPGKKKHTWESQIAEQEGDPPGTPAGIPGAKFAIEMQLTAAGGTPLAHERVRVHDPDTGEQVGEPGVTDDEGVLKAGVPEEKEYEIHLESGATEEHKETFEGHAHPLAGQLPHPDEHPVLHVAFFDGKGEPLKTEPVKVKAAEGDAAPHEVKTDDAGKIDLAVEAGPFILEVRGKSFTAHSVLSGELPEDDAAYRFVVS